MKHGCNVPITYSIIIWGLSHLNTTPYHFGWYSIHLLILKSFIAHVMNLTAVSMSLVACFIQESTALELYYGHTGYHQCDHICLNFSTLTILKGQWKENFWIYFGKFSVLQMAKNCHLVTLVTADNLGIAWSYLLTAEYKQNHFWPDRTHQNDRSEIFTDDRILIRPS